MTQDVTRTGPTISRGRSKQDYGTPRDFIAAVEARFGPLAVDLACTEANAKAPVRVTEKSLSRDWAGEWPTGNLWLNPPFSDLYAWAEKCRKESKKRHGFILFLTPASVGSLWFLDNVRKHAYVFALHSRLTFEGCDDPYPKDCILSVFGHGMRGFDAWHWKNRYPLPEPGADSTKATDE
jgi:phage N-6-adenine-methyltransferase